MHQMDVSNEDESASTNDGMLFPKLYSWQYNVLKYCR